MALSDVHAEVLGNYLGNDGLRVKDFPDLKIDGNHVEFERIPTMVVVRAEFSKAGHRHLTFPGEEGWHYLKNYLEERIVEGLKASGYNRLIDGAAPRDIITSVVTVYEVYKKLKPIRGEAIALSVVVPLRSTRLIPIDDQLALEAADYSLSLGLHFSDALIYATARRYKAVLHTSDPDLKNAPGVVFH